MKVLFDASNGWNVYRHDFGVGASSLPTLWASTVVFARADLSSRFHQVHESAVGLPTETVGSLPRDGIVLVAMGPRAYTGDQDFPLFKPPLRLANAYRKARSAGGPETTEFRFDRWVGEQLLNVAVWLGAKESTHLERAAEDALARLTVA